MTDRHRNIRTILARQLESGRLSHAYLFVGPRGSGKKSLAMELAGKILGLSSVGDLLKHPDYSYLDCASDASAESVREFIGRIFLKPFLSERKFALISNIENLNSQGANALLKTLEEPPQSTAMLLTANTRRVLPTIVSRCQVFSFARRIDAERKWTEMGTQSITDFAGKSLAERLIAINQFAELEEADLQQAIENFLYESAAQLSSAPEKYTRLAAALKAFEDLATNKNRKLVLQGLMMKI